MQIHRFAVVLYSTSFFKKESAVQCVLLLVRFSAGISYILI